MQCQRQGCFGVFFDNLGVGPGVCIGVYEAGIITDLWGCDSILETAQGPSTNHMAKVA